MVPFLSHTQGNRDKIEATISVQRALPKHQGRYQCNSLYKNYHMLYVHRNASDGSEKMMPGRRGPPESILDKLDEPVVGPLLLTSMRPPLITSIAELHHPLSTPESGPLAPLETHHHHHHVDKTDKAASHKPDSGHRAKEPLEGQQLTGKANNHIKVVDSEDPTPDSDKDNEAIVEDTREDGPSGYGGIEEAPPPPPLFEDNVAPPAIDEDDSIDEEQDSIVIESKDVSLEDSLIDKLIMNKSEINGIIRVDDSEEQPPPRQHQHQHRPPSSGGLGKQLDRIRDSSNSQNNMLIAAAVIPTTSSTSTTALVTVPQTPATTTTTTTTTTSTTTTLMPLAPVQKQHVETHGGHHHHHHHEHQQQQQQQQHSATVAPGEDLDFDQKQSQISSSVLITILFIASGKSVRVACGNSKKSLYLFFRRVEFCSVNFVRKQLKPNKLVFEPVSIFASTHSVDFFFISFRTSFVTIHAAVSFLKHSTVSSNHTFIQSFPFYCFLKNAFRFVSCCSANSDNLLHFNTFLFICVRISSCLELVLMKRII